MSIMRPHFSVVLFSLVAFSISGLSEEDVPNRLMVPGDDTSWTRFRFRYSHTSLAEMILFGALPYPAGPALSGKLERTPSPMISYYSRNTPEHTHTRAHSRTKQGTGKRVLGNHGRGGHFLGASSLLAIRFSLLYALLIVGEPGNERQGVQSTNRKRGVIADWDTQSPLLESHERRDEEGQRREVDDTFGTPWWYCDRLRHKYARHNLQLEESF
uniref:Putative secreted protein n=1 Tax=Anopheles darlingi TaxID=43151 RepID=A0A2M4D8S1_ANODA